MEQSENNREDYRPQDSAQTQHNSATVSRFLVHLRHLFKGFKTLFSKAICAALTALALGAKDFSAGLPSKKYDRHQRPIL
jgi:hypothetical protein